MSDEANRRFASTWKSGITIERYIADLENKYDGASKLALERESRAATAEQERDRLSGERDDARASREAWRRQCAVVGGLLATARTVLERVQWVNSGEPVRACPVCEHFELGLDGSPHFHAVDCELVAALDTTPGASHPLGLDADAFVDDIMFRFYGQHYRENPAQFNDRSGYLLARIRSLTGRAKPKLGLFPDPRTVCQDCDGAGDVIEMIDGQPVATGRCPTCKGARIRSLTSRPATKSGEP